MKTSADIAANVSASTAARSGRRLGAYLELTKPRLNSLVLVTTAIGFFLGSRGTTNWWVLLHTLVGTAFVAGAASTLNQYLERDAEKLMTRTKDRPLPSGRLQPNEVIIFGSILGLAGLGYLLALTNPLTALLSAITFGSYLFVYTPLKRHTWLCTIIGAVPGAIPPMLGWTAATNTVTPEAWALFAILFLWQLPHFWAIAWLYRDDYKRANYPMLTVLDTDGSRTSRHVIISTLLLIAASVAPFCLNMAGAIYLAGALALGAAFLAFGIAFARGKTDPLARKLFFASIIYLPLLLTLLLVNKTSLF